MLPTARRPRSCIPRRAHTGSGRELEAAAAISAVKSWWKGGYAMCALEPRQTVVLYALERACLPWLRAGRKQSDPSRKFMHYGKTDSLSAPSSALRAALRSSAPWLAPPSTLGRRHSTGPISCDCMGVRTEKAGRFCRDADRSTSNTSGVCHVLHCANPASPSKPPYY